MAEPGFPSVAGPVRLVDSSTGHTAPEQVSPDQPTIDRPTSARRTFIGRIVDADPTFLAADPDDLPEAWKGITPWPTADPGTFIRIVEPLDHWPLDRPDWIDDIPPEELRQLTADLPDEPERPAA